MKKIIQINKVTKSYKDGNSKVHALKDVSFDINEGEDIAIVGPSGSGKTTLLQIIGGLDNPTSGKVLVDGKNLTDFNDNEISEFRNATIGFVFQMMHLQDYLSALENVMIPMLIARKNFTESRKRAYELLDMVGLKDRTKHSPGKLSGGEMQRVAIARALANDPKILMADEPTGKLDKENADKIMSLLNDLAKTKNLSLIVITHDLDIAKQFKRSIKLSHGKLIS